MQILWLEMFYILRLKTCQLFWIKSENQKCAHFELETIKWLIVCIIKLSENQQIEKVKDKPGFLEVAWWLINFLNTVTLFSSINQKLLMFMYTWV